MMGFAAAQPILRAGGARDERRDQSMSAVFANEAENATEKLQRAGARRLLFDPTPLGGEPGTLIEPPPNAVVRDRFPTPDEEMPLIRSPAQAVDDRFPKPHEMMPTDEPDEERKRDMERWKRKGETDEEWLRRIGREELNRAFRQRGLRRT
jgi:hypothetical protein